MAINPYDQYLESQLTTATPGRLVVLTYDGAIKFAKAAAEKMKERDLEGQNTNIKKVQNIILGLMGSLDMKADTQLAQNLYSLYSFMFDKLTQANIHDDQAALAEATELLMELRQTWAEAELLVRSGGLVAVGEGVRAA